MKKILSSLILCCMLNVEAEAQVTYFNQNFDSSSNLSAYVNNPPAANQFDSSSVAGSGTVSIVSNKLQLTRTAGTGGASITRYTSLGMPATGVFELSFSFDCSASTGTNGTTYFTIGKMNSTDAGSVAVPADLYSLLKLKFVTDNTTSGNFFIQNLQSNTTMSGRAPASGYYSGTKNIIAIFNNTSSSADYTSSDSVKGTVGAMKVDLYVNNVLVIDEGFLSQTTPLAITGLKVNVSSNNAIADFDNIIIRDSKIFKIIAVSDPFVTTQQLSSGNFTIGLTHYGGGMINQLVLPGIGNIMGAQTVRYGRGGQSAIRSMATTGTYNPTQAGFNENIGTQCIISTQPGKLTIQPRPCALWWSDAKYDYTQWENIGSDSFNSDGGNTDKDGIDESTLPGKQSDEVKSEFDYYGTYENYLNKYNITTPAIRHYFEYRFIRNPGNCLAQFSSASPVWKPNLVQSDLSYQYPAGVFAGTDKDMNLMVGEYALRNDTSLWNPGYRFLQDFYGNWQVAARDSSFTGDQNKYRQVFIIAESSDKNTGRALGMYCPQTDINMNSVIGVNEADGSIAYKDNRTNDSYIHEVRYRIPNMAQFGFNRQTLGLINRSRLPNGVYETYRQEYYIFYGTPQEIMNAISALDTALGIKAQASNAYFKQDFNSSVSTTNYTGTTTNLLDGIKVTGTTGAFGTAKMVAGKLNLAKTNAGNAAIARSANLGFPSTGIIQFKFDFDCAAVAGSSANGTPFLALGNNIDPATVNIHPDSNSYIKIKFVTDNTNSGNFIIQNLINSAVTNTTDTLSGPTTLLMVLNNSASNASYTAPDGTSSFLGINKWDLYANNTLLFKNVDVNNSGQAFTGFKLSLTGNNTNINLDNMLILYAVNESSALNQSNPFIGGFVNNGNGQNGISKIPDPVLFDVFQILSNAFQFKIYAKDQQPAEISLIGIDGKIYFKNTLQLSSGYNTGLLPISGLAPGIYLIRLVDGNHRVYVKKVIVFSR